MSEIVRTRRSESLMCAVHAGIAAAREMEGVCPLYPQRFCVLLFWDKLLPCSLAWPRTCPCVCFPDVRVASVSHCGNLCAILYSVVKPLVQQTFLSLGRKSTGRRKVHTGSLLCLSLTSPWLPDGKVLLTVGRAYTYSAVHPML